MGLLLHVTKAISKNVIIFLLKRMLRLYRFWAGLDLLDIQLDHLI